MNRFFIYFLIIISLIACQTNKHKSNSNSNDVLNSTPKKTSTKKISKKTDIFNSFSKKELTRFNRILASGNLEELDAFFIEFNIEKLSSARSKADNDFLYQTLANLINKGKNCNVDFIKFISVRFDLDLNLIPLKKLEDQSIACGNFVNSFFRGTRPKEDVFNFAYQAISHNVNYNITFKEMKPLIETMLPMANKECATKKNSNACIQRDNLNKLRNTLN